MYRKKLYGVATVGTKGQVVIPSDAREELGIQTGDRLYVFGIKEKNIVGFMSEEQLRDMVEKATENVEDLRSALNADTESID